MGKTKMITVTLPENIVKLVDEMAKEDRRSRSKMVSLILEDFFSRKNDRGRE